MQVSVTVWKISRAKKMINGAKRLDTIGILVAVSKDMILRIMRMTKNTETEHVYQNLVCFHFKDFYSTGFM